MSMQMTLSFLLLVAVVIGFSFFMIYNYTSEVFINRYFQEIRRSLSFGAAMRGSVIGHGQMARRIAPELFISLDGEVIQNPDMVEPPDFREGSSIGRVNGSSYLFYGFRDGDSLLLLGLRMSEFDIFLSSLKRVMLITFMLSLAASSIIALLVARRFSRPLKETSEMLQKLMVSDLSQRIDSGRSSREISELNESINTALVKIEQGYRRQQQFSSDVAHEIRSPLTSIIGFSRLILRWGSTDPEVAEEASSNILKTAQSLLGVSEALLYLSMSDRTIERKKANIKDLVSEVAEPFARFRNSQIEVDVPSAEVTTDETLLKIALTNLLDNAVKHSRSQPVIVRWIDQEKELEIIDSAPLIPDSQKEKIFDRFYRSDRSSDLDGYGLGLSLVKKICDEIGLSVRVCPSENRGNRFVVGGFS